MACEECGSTRLMTVGGKVSDSFHLFSGEITHQGYVPPIPALRGDNADEDYLGIVMCLECGVVQGLCPLTDSTLQAAIKEMED